MCIFELRRFLFLEHFKPKTLHIVLPGKRQYSTGYKLPGLSCFSLQTNNEQCVRIKAGN